MDCTSTQSRIIGASSAAGAVSVPRSQDVAAHDVIILQYMRHRGACHTHAMTHHDAAYYNPVTIRS